MQRPAMRLTGWSGCFVHRWKRARFSCSLRPRARRPRTSALKSRPPSRARCGACCSSVPRHLLAADYADWDAFLLEALIASEKLPAACRDLASCSWGKVNAVRVAHPLSAALPLFSGFLDMPTVRVAGGHHDMPRIQGPDYGASERFSVAPGHEDEGYFHMPGGQSGHPLSPFYRAGFSAWVEGRPTPFLPGPAAHSLILMPIAPKPRCRRAISARRQARANPCRRSPALRCTPDSRGRPPGCP